MEILFIYLLLINALCFVLMLIDKKKARAHARRIPEAALFFFAALGGSLGSFVGMYACRHKTRHLKFTLGIPALLLLQAGLLYFLLR